jgi:PST family polysaccharide transporter
VSSEAPNDAGSQRQILKATSISGSASIINVLTSIAKVKLIALLVGPTGIGLMGLYQRVMSLVATIAGFGLAQSGVRQVAASPDPNELARVRRALFVASLALGLIAWAILWGVRERVSLSVFGDTAHADAIGWLGLGVLFTSITTSQTALLQGLRRITDLAKVSVLGSLLGALIGLGLIAWLGVDGIVWMLIATPLTGALVAWRYTSRLPAQPAIRIPLSDLVPRWRALLVMGFAIMAANIVSNLVQLDIRSTLVEDFGLPSAGHFEASWQVSMTYIGFVLTAMGTDYFPRLTAAIHDRDHSNRLVNEQAEVALLLAAPVLIGLAGLAPIGIHVLYSADFGPSIELLRIQALGDTLKILSWPLAFVFLAHGANRFYLVGELLWNAVFFALVTLLLPTLGLVATSIAYVVSYLVYLVFTLVVARHLNGLVLERRVVVQAAAIFVTALALIALSYVSELATWIAGATATLAVGLSSLGRLARMLGGQGRIGRLLAKLRFGR